MSEDKQYSIDGKTYFQRTLVYGQIRQIFEIFKKLDYGKKGEMKQFTVSELISILGDHLMEFIAILIIPEGSEPKDKDNESIAKEIEWAITGKMILEVMEDFFTLNLVSDIQEKVVRMMKNYKQAMTQSKASTT